MIYKNKSNFFDDVNKTNLMKIKYLIISYINNYLLKKEKL